MSRFDAIKNKPLPEIRQSGEARDIDEPGDIEAPVSNIPENNLPAGDNSATDEQVFNAEKYFTPSLSQDAVGMLKPLIYDDFKDRGADEDKLTDETLEEYVNFYVGGASEEDTKLLTPGQRYWRNIYRGMDNMKGRQNALYEKMFTKAGMYNRIDTSMDAGRGVGETTMVVHSNTTALNYSNMMLKKKIREYTWWKSPKMIVHRLSLIKKHGSAKAGKIFNEKLKRGAMLDVIQQKGLNENGYRKLSRSDLKVLYEEAYRQRKSDEAGPGGNAAAAAKTGLDYNEALRPEELGIQEDKRKELVDMMKQMSRSDASGHAWVEFLSKDRAGENRVRFTMGFCPYGAITGGSMPNTQLSSQNGIVVNPDICDRDAGAYRKSELINKKSYVNALNFAIRYEGTKYSLAKSNCSTFAAKMAEAAGVSIQGGALSLGFFGKMYAPDKLSEVMEKVPDDTDPLEGSMEPDLNLLATILDVPVADMLRQAEPPAGADLLRSLNREVEQDWHGETEPSISPKMLDVLLDRVMGNKRVRNAFIYLNKGQKLYYLDLIRVKILKKADEVVGEQKEADASDTSDSGAGPFDKLYNFVDNEIPMLIPEVTDNGEALAENFRNEMDENSGYGMLCDTHIGLRATDLLLYMGDSQELASAIVKKLDLMPPSLAAEAERYTDVVNTAFCIAYESSLIFFREFMPIYTNYLHRDGKSVTEDFINECFSMKSATGLKTIVTRYIKYTFGRGVGLQEKSLSQTERRSLINQTNSQYNVNLPIL